MWLTKECEMRTDAKALVAKLTAERDEIDATIKALTNGNGAAPQEKRKRSKWSPEARARAAERAKACLAALDTTDAAPSNS
jgi:hypothetical protein